MPGDSDIGGLTLRDLYCSERKAREQRLSYLRYRTQLSRESLPEEEERVGLKCEILLTKETVEVICEKKKFNCTRFAKM